MILCTKVCDSNIFAQSINQLCQLRQKIISALISPHSIIRKQFSKNYLQTPSYHHQSMSTFGRWNDEDDVATKKQNRNFFGPSPAFSEDNNTSNGNNNNTNNNNDITEDDLSKTHLAVDVSDIVDNHQLRHKISLAQAQSLPPAWRPDNNNNSNKDGGKGESTLGSFKKMMSSGKFLPPMGSNKDENNNNTNNENLTPSSSTALERFRLAANATRFTNLVRKKGLHSPDHHNSLHHNDDDLTAYISAKEERKREKEAAKKIVQDAHVPVHVKQRINQEMQSRGSYRSKRQYGYTEPTALPLKRRTDGFNNNNNNNSSTLGSPQSGRTLPSSSIYEGIAQHEQNSNNNNKLMNAADQDEEELKKLRRQQQKIQMQQQQQRKPQWNDSMLPPLVEMRNHGKRVRASSSPAVSNKKTGQKDHQENNNGIGLDDDQNQKPQKSFKQQQSSSRALNFDTSTTTTSNHQHSRIHNNNINTTSTSISGTTTSQYLSEIRMKENITMTAELPPDCQKVVDESVASTQNYRDKIRRFKEELDELTITAQHMKREISNGSEITRKHAEMQQVKIKLESDKRLREQRIKDMEMMIGKMAKRLQKQEEEKHYSSKSQQDSSSCFLPTIGTSNKNNNNTNANGSYIMNDFLNNSTEVTSAQTNNNKKTLPPSSQKEISEMHRKIEDLKLHRDALLKEREVRNNVNSRRSQSAPAQKSQPLKMNGGASNNGTPSATRRSGVSSAKYISNNSTKNTMNRNNNSSKRRVTTVDDDDAPPPKPKELNTLEKEQISDEVAVLKKKLANDLERELKAMKDSHERAMNHRRRVIEKRLEGIVNSQHDIEKKLNDCSSTAETQQNQTNEARIAQLALDTQVAEKQQQLQAVMEQRRTNELSLKKIINQASNANALLSKLRQELLVAEDVPVEQHKAEDEKRSKTRGAKTQAIAKLKQEEQKLNRNISDMKQKLEALAGEVVSAEKLDASKDANVVRLQEESAFFEKKGGQLEKQLEKAQKREAAAKSRLQTAKQRLKENDAQDQEISRLTKEVEAKKFRLRDEHSRNMDLLEKLDRAERLASMSSGLAGMS